MGPVPMTSSAAFFGRILWMIAGPILLVLTAISIVDRGAGWFTLSDAAFATILGAMILGRWLEFRYGDPMTAMGEPATEADFRRYALAVVTAGAAVWVLANLFGNHGQMS